MDKEEQDYIIKRALRNDFDNSHKERQIQIYQVCCLRKYEELEEEMKQDLNSDYNLNL